MSVVLTTPTDPPEWQGRRPARFFARLAGEPALARGIRELCDAVRESLPPRTLELVALYVSAELECLYAWHGHSRLAFDGRLLSYADIAGAAVGPAAFTGADAVLLQAAAELLRDDRLTGPTRAALGDDTGVKAAVAAYRLVAWLMEGIGPEPGIPPVSGLKTPTHARATYAALTCADAAHPDSSEAA